jgi:hypothetical protein
MSAFSNCVQFIENEQKLTGEMKSFLLVATNGSSIDITVNGDKVQINDMMFRLMALMFSKASSDITRNQAND